VSSLRAMPGFGLALLTLHLAAVPLGVAWALVVALLPSIGWSLLLMAQRRARVPYGSDRSVHATQSLTAASKYHRGA